MKAIADTLVLSQPHPLDTWFIKLFLKGFLYILWNIRPLLCNGTSWAKQRQRRMKIKETKIVSFLLLWFRKLKGATLHVLFFITQNLYLLSFLGAVELSALQKGSTIRWDFSRTKQWQKMVCRVGDLQWHFQLWLQLWSGSSDAGTGPAKPDSLPRNSSLNGHVFAGVQSQPFYIHSAKH